MDSIQPRFPNVKVSIVGESMNVRDILSRVTVALLDAGEQTASLDFHDTATVLLDAGEMQEFLNLVVATVDATGDSTIGTCYYCDQPAMDADNDMCEFHYDLDQDYRRQLSGRDEG